MLCCVEITELTLKELVKMWELVKLP